MKKNRTDLLFDERIEQIFIHYVDDDDMWKIDYVTNFMKKNFHVEEVDNSFIEIEKIHAKSLLWLLVSLIIDYEAIKKTDERGRQEKYKSLEVKDIFSVKEMTPEDVVFIEHCLSKTNVDLDKVNIRFVISTNQVIYLLRNIMQEYKTFLGNGEKFEE